MISIIALFKIPNAVTLSPKILFLIAVYVFDFAAVNPNFIETLLAYRVSTFSNNGKPVFNNGLRKLSNLNSCLTISPLN